MSSITLDIKGRPWKFSLIPDKRFDKLYNSDNDEAAAAAITLPTIYEVQFRRSDWDIITIRHELLHVLFNMGLSGSADLTPHQVEEICAEIVANHCSEIVLWSDRIAEKFLGRE